MIPYGRQSINEEDINAVVEVLRSDWLTTGPKVKEFEGLLSEYVGTKHSVAMSSGTAALHATMYALGIGTGDEVIIPPITFVATANCVVYQGGKPIFADVDEDTLLINPDDVEKKITNKTKAIIAVDYAGQPCDYDRLRDIANKYQLVLVADSCHALGAKFKDHRVGTLADMTIFSFHPVKHITTGEGGMVATNNPGYDRRLRQFRNHGILSDHIKRAEDRTWYYEMTDLGFNYRITDIQCALGISQFRRLSSWIARRREIAAQYNEAFASNPKIKPLRQDVNNYHVFHLYVVKIETASRKKSFLELRNAGIGINVHYIPVHLQPYYRNKFGTGEGLCPTAESAYEKIISLPIFPAMADSDIQRVIETVDRLLG